jgi:hypothetical protein
MPATTSLRDCSQLVTATREAGGKAPKVLTNILAGAQLLDAHSAVIDPARAIVAASADGTLTGEKLGELITEAAHTQMVNTYLGELRQRSERMFVEQFHKALRSGACDELLGTLRPIWDEHAAAVGQAKHQISPESSVEHIIMSGDSGLVECWQQLPEHLAALNRIALVARQFGPRVGNFPLVREFANAADNYKLEDSAIWCAAGNLEADSAAFRRPGTHRQSPLFNVTLRLNTLEQARERYRIWASAQWEQQHSGPTGGWIDEDGEYHEQPRPANPYAATQ